VNEELKYKGYWWLPEKPDDKIPGQLRITPRDGAILELQGTLHDALRLSEHFRPPLILGFSETGKSITLYDCILTQARSSIPGFSISTLYAENAFIGVHFTTVEEISFRSLSVHYAYLDEWANKSGLTSDYSQEDKGILTIRYERPEPIKLKAAGYEIVVSFAGPGWTFGLTEAKITQKAWIQFRPERDMPLDDYLEIVYHVQNFLSLAMTQPTRPLDMGGMTEASKEVLEDGRERYYPVEIFRRWLPLPTEARTPATHEMLFSLLDVQDQLETYVANWVSKADVLGPVYNLYFSTLYSPHQYLETEFLSVAQAIETYHRRKFGGKFQSDEEYSDDLYKRFVEVIPPELDSDFKDSLKSGVLKYANEFSLRRRLREITDRLSLLGTIGFIALEEARRNFVNKVVNTRNYLTHYNPYLQDKVTRVQELYDLTQKLKTLLEICLLEELGFSLSTIRDMTFKHRKYKYISQLR
jgi:hypothetical protein